MLKLLESRRDENDLVSLSLDELARLGAQRLLAEALELEVAVLELEELRRAGRPSSLGPTWSWAMMARRS